MPAISTPPVTLPHAVFLERAVSQPVTSPAVSLGQGAFLALRLLDLLAPDHGAVETDAFQYQCAATTRYCRGLQNDTTEAAHLQEIVRSTAEAQRQREPRLVAPGLLAYAHCLEDEGHYEEALDVLETMLRVGGERLVRSDAIAATLRVARVNRKLARFDEAEAAYDEAAALAAAAGDSFSALLSRLGRAETLRGRGNLADAETALWETLADARAVARREAEALVEHSLGIVIDARGQSTEAITHVWRAFERYEDDESRVRALNDLGLMLLRLGDADGAQCALTEVVRRSSSQDTVDNAMIELMHCASYRRDHIGFERWRARCESRTEKMPPNILADFYFKAGIGEARFGRFGRAEALMAMALRIANESGLHEFEFRIERIKNGLRECQRELARAPLEIAEPVGIESLREVRRSLSELADARA